MEGGVEVCRAGRAARREVRRAKSILWWVIEGHDGKEGIWQTADVLMMPCWHPPVEGKKCNKGRVHCHV